MPEHVTDLLSHLNVTRTHMRPGYRLGGPEAPRVLSLWLEGECGWQGTDWGLGPRSSGCDLEQALWPRVRLRVYECVCTHSSPPQCPVPLFLCLQLLSLELVPNSLHKPFLRPWVPRSGHSERPVPCSPPPALRLRASSSERQTPRRLPRGPGCPR